MHSHKFFTFLRNFPVGQAYPDCVPLHTLLRPGGGGGTSLILQPEGFLITLPYICLGAGSGALGYGISNIITDKLIQKNPGMQKQMEIDENDGRNILLATRAKAKAYDLMTLVFGVLMLLFTLMTVDVIPVLLFVSAYLFVQGYQIYYHYKYNKEM